MSQRQPSIAPKNPLRRLKRPPLVLLALLLAVGTVPLFGSPPPAASRAPGRTERLLPAPASSEAGLGSGPQERSANPCDSPFFDPACWTPSNLLQWGAHTLLHLALPSIQTILRDPSDIILHTCVPFTVSMVTADGIAIMQPNSPSPSCPHDQIAPALWNLYVVFVGVADSSFALFIVLMGLHVMLQGTVALPRSDLAELASRVLLGFLASHAALLVIAFLVDVNNDLCDLVQQQLGYTSFFALLSSFLTENWITQNFWTFWVGLIMGILVLLLYVVMLVRFALLIVAIMFTPLACILSTSDWTAAWTKLWAQVLVTTLFLQVIIVTCLGLGDVLLSSTAQAIGGLGKDASLIQALLGLAVLSLALTIPRLLSRWVVLPDVRGMLAGAVKGLVKAVTIPAP